MQFTKVLANSIKEPYLDKKAISALSSTHLVSFDKIKSLGFKVRYDLDTGIKEMMEAFKFIKGKDIYFNNRVFK